MHVRARDERAHVCPNHVYLPKLLLLLLEHPKFQKNLYLQGRCSHADKSWRWNDLYSVSSTAKAQMDAL